MASPAISKSTILFGVLLGSFVLAYFPVWTGLIGAWSRSDEYSHGFLIVPICLYIARQKRDFLAATPLKPRAWGFVLVALSLGLYIFSYFAEIATTASLSMVAVFIGSLVYLYGWKHTKGLAFPLFLLLFMIPVPGQIYAEATIPLQLLVSKVSVWAAANLGLAIYREGNVVHLPGLTLEVVQACSGLRSMVSLLVLAAVLGYFTMKSNMPRTALFVSAIPISIVVNILRVLGLAMAWDWFSYDLTKGPGHTVSGIMVFGLALLFMVMARDLLVRWDIQSKKE